MRMPGTYALAMAAGRDAGNDHMRRHGRTSWNDDDYREAVRVRNALLLDDYLREEGPEASSHEP